MSLTLSGWSLSSLRSPFSEILAILFGKGDIKSMFCLIGFFIVSIVLAYLTNPSENSFRAYLTEQSFRHHLSRLDDTSDDPRVLNDFSSSYPTRITSSAAQLISVESNVLFHFSNRASIALRTPKHVFHSFAIFTIAAMIPLSTASDGKTRDAWMISDSWYIGAFGKWWRGGVLEAWYQDVVARSKDEESWSSGILSMKSIDFLENCNITDNTRASRGSPPKLRNRERSTYRPISQPRSSSPPPLPKSAALPMHTSGKSLYENSSQQSTQVQHYFPKDAAKHVGSSSTAFERLPVIADVMSQISSAKGSVLELRSQLLECESVASQSRAVLQHEVDIHRDRKRQEDSSKLELKSRTKLLEDSKRAAETLKKEAEKKLKSLQSLHDGTSQHMDFLDREISKLQESLSDDQGYIFRQRNNVSVKETDLSEDVEQKRIDIKAADNLFLKLNQRSRDLEERLATEKEKLRVLRGESVRMKQNLNDVHFQPRIQEEWNFQRRASLFSVQNMNKNIQSSLVQEEVLISKFGRNRHTSLSSSLPSVNDVHSSTKGSLLQVSDLSFNMTDVGHLVSSQLVSDHVDASLRLDPVIELESDVSRSLQSDRDSYVDGEWRYSDTSSNLYHNHELDLQLPFDGSKLLYLSDDSDNSVDGRYLPDFARDKKVVDNTVDLRSASWIYPDLDSPDREPDLRPVGNFSIPRRWFAGEPKWTKGLNPDAKEFSLLPKSGNAMTRQSFPLANTYDALNPNGLGSVVSTSSSSANQSLLRAFAPSPAEREALQRALGSSANASLEKLSSLNNVGSISASPVDSQIHSNTSHRLNRNTDSILPNWLPGARKVKFSPWEDEEPSFNESQDHSKGNANC